MYITVLAKKAWSQFNPGLLIYPISINNGDHSP